MSLDLQGDVQCMPIQMGYNPNEISIDRLKVKIDDTCIFDEDAKSHRRHAIWIELLMQSRGFRCRDVTTIQMDEDAYANLRRFVGEDTCDQTMMDEGKEYPFVYALLVTENSGLNVVVEVEWKVLVD